MEIDPALIHRLFYPQVPAVFSAQHDGKVSAMPVVSYSSVSDLPAMVAVACFPGGFTLKLALDEKSFSLCLLDRRRLKAIEVLASKSGKSSQDKIAEANLTHRIGKKVSAPVIVEAMATIECEVSSKKRTGDHILVFGLVKAAYSKDRFSGFWDFARYRPILYTGWRDGATVYPGS